VLPAYPLSPPVIETLRCRGASRDSLRRRRQDKTRPSFI